MWGACTDRCPDRFELWKMDSLPEFDIWFKFSLMVYLTGKTGSLFWKFVGSIPAVSRRTFGLSPTAVAGTQPQSFLSKQECR
jgi:hypothetical protein